MRDFGNFPGGVVPPALLERATREIETYTVSLIRDQRLTGSGTLVKVCGASGILTAHHVSSLVCKDQDGMLGINIATYAHGFFVPVSRLRHHVVGESKEEDGKPFGPDLAFLEILDPQKLATIESKKSFFRVNEENLRRFLDLPSEGMSWWVAGAPDEFSEHFGVRGTGSHILKAQHSILEGTFVSRAEREGFDYVEAHLISGEHNYPTNLGGVSGGGLWVVPFIMDPSKGLSTLDYEAPLLAGVAFYQSGPREDGRVITAHGPRSIYIHLVHSLEGQTRRV